MLHIHTERKFFRVKWSTGKTHSDSGLVVQQNPGFTFLITSSFRVL